jgi:serine protease
MATGLPAHLTEANHEWVLDFSNFRSAWLKSKGAGITIAHPDTGWTMHPELVDSTYLGDLSINFYEPPRNSRVCTPNDNRLNARDQPTRASKGHGTATAGVIVSPVGHPNGLNPETWPTAEHREGSPNAFVSGAAPEATVIPFRVTENPLLMDAQDAAIAKCIYHCIGLRANKGIDVGVMSISLGGSRSGTEKKIKDALAAARQAGIVMIAAAGQLPGGHGSWWGGLLGDTFNPVFPGSSPDTICVAGCTSRHFHLQDGFYGKEVDISAPAVNVWMSRTNWRDEAEEYRIERSDGTSYATALTAAACALWQSYHTRQKLIGIYGRPRLHAAFKYCLQRSAYRPPEWDHIPPPLGPPPASRGAGELDVESLLDTELPSVEDVDRQVPQ